MESAHALLGRAFRAGMLAGWLVSIAGCEPLVAQPGHDFKLELLTPTLSFRQQVGVAEVRFRLSGCADFQLTGSRLSEIQLEPVRAADGSFSVQVPISWLTTSPGFCPNSDSRPSEFYVALRARCRANQKIASAQVRFAMASMAWAWFVGRPLPEPTTLHSNQGTSLVALGGGLLHRCQLEQNDSSECSEGEVAQFAGRAGEEDLFEWNEQVAYLIPKCSGRVCETERTIRVEVPGRPPLDVPAVSVSEFHLGAERIDFKRRFLAPQGARDAAFEVNGDLWLLDSVLTRISPGQAPQTTFVGLLPQSDFTRLPDGRLAFLAWVVDHVALVTPSGEILQSYEGGPTGRVFMDPARPRWLVATSADFWLVTYPGSWRKLERLFGFSGEGVEWLDDAVVLWSSKSVHLVPLDGSERSSMDLNMADSGPGLPLSSARGVAGTRDVLFLTTNTGVRIYNRQGALVGGADPLPCEWAPTSAAVINGSRAVVATGQYLFGFDLSQY